MGRMGFLPVVFLLVGLSLVPLRGEDRGNGGSANREAAGAVSRMNEGMKEGETDISPRDAYYIGRAVGANILRRYRPYRSPGLTAYLNRICNALVINSRRPALYNGYHVLILDSAGINAMASPGGHIFVTLGLIKSAPSEDVLAAVIAHEIAHVQLGHGIEHIQNARQVRALSGIAAFASAAADRQKSLQSRVDLFDASITEALDRLLKNGYSQYQEFEADIHAMSLLAGAGYQASALIDMLKILERVQPGTPGGFNTTHPAPAMRRVNAEQAVTLFPPGRSGERRQRRFREAMRRIP